MKKLCSLLFVTMVIFLLLLPHLTLSATTPEKYYINCGSNSDVTYGGRGFVGDMSLRGNSVSFAKEGSEAINQSGPSITSSEIYRTVRIFRRSASYKIQLDSVGLHIVRLHFYAVSSRTELLAARFDVSATYGSTRLLKSFSGQNSSETPLVEEFLLMMNSSETPLVEEFEVLFVPQRSSLAFVNAIEVFSVRNDLEKLSDPETNLRTLYRLNVGGEKVTPDNDTLGRTWSRDDDFLYLKDSAKNSRTTQDPNYEEGSLSARTLTAPDFVYKTAKAMNRSSGLISDLLMNITWSFNVKPNSKHFVRAHFCDFLSELQNSDSDFYLFVNGQQRIDVRPSLQNMLVTPFYIDAVDVSDGSGVFNVSIGTKEVRKDAGFLNGLEVMEVLNKADSSSSGGSSSRVYIIAGCVAAAALILILIALCIVFFKRRSSRKKTKPDDAVTVWSGLPPSYRGAGSSDQRSFFPGNNNSPLRNLHLGLKIPFNDILIATNNFDEQLLIGKGGFGDVYKAILPDGRKAAIKRAKSGSGQGIHEFHTEIQVLSRIRHKHLVSLTGYCDEHSEMILVYEFMEKGTLKEHLYGTDFPTLTWKQRLEICIGAARGLNYLHGGAEGAIIHRDIKTTNILLDDNTIAKVADFGLSKLAIHNNQDPTDIITGVKGTFGYLDPEYMETQILTEKSDVYAFGVVLLEVLCARPAINRYLSHEEANLADWAMFCKSKGEIEKIVDPKLTGQIETNSLRKFMEIVEKCLKENGEERSSMADVIWDLEYVQKLQTMTIQREPHDDSVATFSGDASLVIPRLMVTDSFSTNSFVPMSSYGGTDSSENRVFSQLKTSEAR
ncbi:unnamed protein product [Cochlearia groenlandica]